MSLIVQITPYLGQSSSQYPDHPFKLGFFISADNEDGFDAVLEPKIDVSLNKLFLDASVWNLHEGALPTEVCSENNDWARIKEGVDLAINRLNRYLLHYPWLCVREMRVEDIDFDIAEEEVQIETLQEVLRFFNDEIDLHNENPGWVRNHSGIFYLSNQTKTFALVRGKNSDGEKTIFVLQESNLGPDYYMQGLEIIRETIEEILNMPEQQRGELCIEFQR